MKKSLESLSNISQTEIDNAINKGHVSANILEFISALRDDLKQTAANTSDTLNFANNVMTELFIASREEPKFFSQEYIDKLDQISQIPGLLQGQDQWNFFQLLGCMTEGVFLKEKALENKQNEYQELAQTIFDKHMDNIKEALEKKDSLALIEHLKVSGQFQRALSKTKKINIINRESEYLPDLTLLSRLKSFEGGFKEIDRPFLSDIENGINKYIESMGKERTDNVLNNIGHSEQALNEMEALVNFLLPSNAEQKAKSAQVLKELQINNDKCKAALNKAITKEVLGIPELADKYKTEGETVDVDRLIKDLENRLAAQEKRLEDPNARQFLDKYIPLLTHSLKINIDSYMANERLLKIIDSKEPNTLVKLEKFKKEYESDATNNAFKTNPDGVIKRFFKAYGYLLANVFTLGAAHLITKGSPLHSKQQEFGKQQEKILKSAEINQVIKPKR